MDKAKGYDYEFCGYDTRDAHTAIVKPQPRSRSPDPPSPLRSQPTAYKHDLPEHDMRDEPAPVVKRPSRSRSPHSRSPTRRQSLPTPTTTEAAPAPAPDTQPPTGKSFVGVSEEEMAAAEILTAMQGGIVGSTESDGGEASSGQESNESPDEKGATEGRHDIGRRGSLPKGFEWLSALGVEERGPSSQLRPLPLPNEMAAHLATLLTEEQKLALRALEDASVGVVDFPSRTSPPYHSIAALFAPHVPLLPPPLQLPRHHSPPHHSPTDDDTAHYLSRRASSPSLTPYPNTLPPMSIDPPPQLSPPSLRALAHVEKVDGLLQCPEPGCFQTFNRRYNLQAHFAAKHRSHKPYTCGWCGRAFSRKHDMNRHGRTKHPGLYREGTAFGGERIRGFA
ncbi:hypothetical protein HDV00_012208 [Rhizophlyctis rosea]|nr:hypothetical protein HDV00_012208 [Rhizophlyctis rosea]